MDKNLHFKCDDEPLDSMDVNLLDRSIIVFEMDIQGVCPQDGASVIHLNIKDAETLRDNLTVWLDKQGE